MGTYRVVMQWDDFDSVSEYIVQVEKVEYQALVGCYHLAGGSVFTPISGSFPIRMIQKMEKIA
jgi:hypothetical protein